jgi:hypothetical protein
MREARVRVRIGVWHYMRNQVEYRGAMGATFAARSLARDRIQATLWDHIRDHVWTREIFEEIL